jgi:hypothetical protein
MIQENYYVIVNGQTYIDKIKQVEDATREGIGRSRLGAFAAMASVMMSSTTMFDSTDFGVKERKLDRSINIVKEYELIQRKACKLSKWERDKVVQLFNERYEKVDNPQRNA